MTVSTITRNFNGVQNFVQMDCNNTLMELTTAGFLSDRFVYPSIIATNNGSFDFLANDLILITYSGGTGLFNYDANNNCFSMFVPAGESVFFEPTVSFDNNGDLAVNYATRESMYSIIGNVLFINVDILFTPTYTNASGNLRISLPKINHRVVSSSINDIGNNIVFPNGITEIVPIVFRETSLLLLRGIGSATETILGTATFTSGTQRKLTIGVTYLLS